MGDRKFERGEGSSSEIVFVAKENAPGTVCVCQIQPSCPVNFCERIWMRLIFRGENRKKPEEKMNWCGYETTITGFVFSGDSSSLW